MKPESMILLLKAVEVANKAGVKIVVSESAERWDAPPVYSADTPALRINTAYFEGRTVHQVAWALFFSAARASGKAADDPAIDREWKSFLAERNAARLKPAIA